MDSRYSLLLKEVFTSFDRHRLRLLKNRTNPYCACFSVRVDTVDKRCKGYAVLPSRHIACSRLARSVILFRNDTLGLGFNRCLTKQIEELETRLET